jgi:hypothetical protein
MSRRAFNLTAFGLGYSLEVPYLRSMYSNRRVALVRSPFHLEIIGV